MGQDLSWNPKILSRGGNKLLCHLLLMAPLLALVLFFVYPMEIALPLYLVILLLSLFFYRKVMGSMRRPVTTGFEGMMGATATVIGDINPVGQILYKGELWKAASGDRLGKGEKALIVGREGMVLQVKRRG